MDSVWVESSNCACKFPANAVLGGHDSNGSKIYVGRAGHECELLPASVIPCKGSAYISHAGKEHKKCNYEVLVGHGYSWLPCPNDTILKNAVCGGKTKCGELLYIGRGHHANSLRVGKIQPTHCTLYIPYCGQEVPLKTYEILVKQNNNWVSSQSGSTPPEAVVGGQRAGDSAPIYVARAMHEGKLVPGKFIPSRSNNAFICYDGREHNKPEFEVLCGEGYNWVRPNEHAIPSNAVVTDNSSSGEPLFIGRGDYEGNITPGYISVTDRCLYIAYNGLEIRIDQYEVLCQY